MADIAKIQPIGDTEQYTLQARILGTSSLGSTTKGIYLDAGFPKENSYNLNATINSGTKYLMPRYNENTTIGSSSVCQVDNISYSIVTPDYTSGGEQYYKAWLKYVCENYPNADLHICTINPNSKGPCIGNIYSVTDRDSTTGLPRYSTFIFHNLAGNLEVFGTHNYNYWHRNILTDNNYTSYTVTKTGGGASGTWGISISGNAATATKATQDGSGNTITSKYVTIDTAQTITGNKSWGTSGAGGRLNGTATNGGLNSILIGDDVWLGDCNVGGTLGLKSNNSSDARIYFYGSDGTSRGGLYYNGTGHSTVGFYGAVWNDYAEMRNVPDANICEDNLNIRNIKLAGRCVREVGDDTMVLSAERMQPGCKIISDTFGFNIGETDECKTPIAVSGRALVYIYEGREAARQHIGQPVCSGPDGTVSIMTDEEYATKGYCCVGTISAVPEYETWGSGNVQVDGRIWIYVR